MLRYSNGTDKKIPTYGISDEQLENWKNLPCILEVDLKYPVEVHDLHHRLNGSSSPVLTATHSYGKGQNSTPYKIKTPERIRMKFCTVDYVLEISPQNKFGDGRSSGGFWVNM